MPCWMTGKYLMEFGQATDSTLLFNALKTLDKQNIRWATDNQFDRLIQSTVDEIIKTGQIKYGETSESRNKNGKLSGYQAALELKREYAKEVVITAAEQWRLELTEDPTDEEGLTFFAGVRGE